MMEKFRDDAGARADVNDVVGAGLDVGRQRVGAGEARDHQARAPCRALHEQRREQRRVFGGARRVALLLDRERELLLVGRGGHRVRPRRLLLPLQVLEERGEAPERLELVGVDGQEMAGLVVQAIVAGEQHQGGGVGCLRDDVGDHDLHLLDAAAGRCGFDRLRAHVSSSAPQYPLCLTVTAAAD